MDESGWVGEYGCVRVAVRASVGGLVSGLGGGTLIAARGLSVACRSRSVAASISCMSRPCPVPHVGMHACPPPPSRRPTNLPTHTYMYAHTKSHTQTHISGRGHLRGIGPVLGGEGELDGAAVQWRTHAVLHLQENPASGSPDALPPFNLY